MDIRKFQQHSSFPFDKITLLRKGSIYITAGNSQEITLFNTSKKHLVDGIFSSDNWNTTRREYGVIYNNRDDFAIHRLRSYDTKTTIVISNNRSITLSYKIWGFVNELVDYELERTDNITETDYIIRDKNYAKLFKTGYNAFGTSEIITHNLGFVPIVKTWLNYSDYATPYSADDDIYIDSEKVILNGRDRQYLYRIYANEA